MTNKPLLNDPAIFPTEDILKNVLGKNYATYEELIAAITSPEVGFVPEWRYYKDGNAWLCKVCHKKKTVFWLSVWDKFFRTGFYFTEKTKAGVMHLPIDEKIKAEFARTEPAGKLIALSLAIDKKKQIKDVLELVRYKKSLK